MIFFYFYDLDLDFIRFKEKAAKYWQKYLEAMNAVAEETGTPLDEKNDEGFCDAYVFLSSFYVEKNKDLMLGEGTVPSY